MRALFAIIRNDFIICMHFRFDPIYAHGSSGTIPPAEFHNTISQFHNANFTIRPASFRIQPPSVTIQVSESTLHISQSDRQVSQSDVDLFTKGFFQGFLWISWWFLAFFFRFHLVHVQSFCKVSFHVSCAFVSPCLDAFLLQISLRVSFGFLARFLLSFLLVSWRFLSGTHFFDSFPRSRPATAEPQTQTLPGFFILQLVQVGGWHDDAVDMSVLNMATAPYLEVS